MSTLHIIASLSKKNQGNVNSVNAMKLCSGQTQMLIALSDGKVYIVHSEETMARALIREVQFSCIPGGWEISGIASFNRSKDSDDFFIAIAVESNVPNTEGEITGQLNIYSEPNTGVPFDVRSTSQNCSSIPLNFQPHHLMHTNSIKFTNGNIIKEVVWLLYGSDKKMHMFREEPNSYSYFEDDIADYFSEFTTVNHQVLWFDVKYTNNFNRRLSAVAYDINLYEVYSMDTLTNTNIRMVSEIVFQGITRVQFFSLKPQDVEKESDVEEGEIETINGFDITGEDIHLLVCIGMGYSLVFMNVDKDFHTVRYLEESNSNDLNTCACIADLDFNGCNEIVIGNYDTKCAVYRLTPDGWELWCQINAPGSVYGMIYADILGDGVKELVMSTMAGIHVFQHDLDELQKDIVMRLKRPQEDDDDEEEGKDDKALARKKGKPNIEEPGKEDMECEEVYEN